MSTEPVAPISRRLVVVVTGAAGALGSATVRSFHEAGAVVVATDRTAALTSSRQAEFAAMSVAAEAGEVTQPADVAAVVAGVLDRHGRIDVLVHCAGGSLAQLTRASDKPLWDLTDDDWSRVVATNLTGAFTWTRAVGDVMRRQGDGVIILVSSGAAYRGGRHNAAYAAAKAGVLGLMRAAAMDLGASGVRVNAICPGVVPHPGLPPGAFGDRALGGYLDATALGTTTTPEDFAAAAVFLAGQPHQSAQVVNLDSFILF